PCFRGMDVRSAVEAVDSWLSRRLHSPASSLPGTAVAGAAAGSTQPFYASFSLPSTHFDYTVPEPWSKYYQPTASPYGNGNAIVKIPANELPLLRNQYDNALRYADYWVGRIVDALKAADAFDNCAIAIIGDHGEAFMEHG